MGARRGEATRIAASHFLQRAASSASRGVESVQQAKGVLLILCYFWLLTCLCRRSRCPQHTS